MKSDRLLILMGCTIIVSLMTQVVWADEIDDLIPAIIQVESGGDKEAVGTSGEIGLCQISPIVLREYIQWRNDEYYGKRASPMLADSNCSIAKELYDGREEIRFNDSLRNLTKPWYNKKVASWYLRRLRDHYLKEVIRENTQEDMWLDQLWDKYDNVADMGIKDHNDYAIALMLGAYNWGIGNVRKVEHDPSRFPKSVKGYIKKVMALYERGKNG